MLLGNDAKARTMPEDKLFYFTAADHKTPAIARNILIMLMLNDLSNAKDEKATYRTMLPHVLYYAYLSAIMPRFCYNRLRTWIRIAIDTLEKKQDLPSFLDVPVVYRADVLRILKEWLHEAADAVSVRRLRKAVMKSEFMKLGPKSCAKQEAFYIDNGVLIMSPSTDALIATELPALCEAYNNYSTDKPTKLKRDILDSIDTRWAPNVTMLDLQWERFMQNHRDDEVQFSQILSSLDHS